MAEPRDLTSILEELLDDGVRFVLVGALAAVAQGAPLTTHDVDIVHARTPENFDRLVAALEKVHARYRGRPPGDTVRPDRKALATTRRSLLLTDLGPLDCLGAIEGGRDYDALLPLSIDIDLGGRSLAVLGLETIVALKRSSTEPKGRLALPILQETLRRRGRDGSA